MSEEKTKKKSGLRKLLKLVVALLALMVVLSIIFTYTGTMVYGGRVVEAESGRPVEGAVVVAVWRGERATVAGAMDLVEDVKETLTDNNGQWQIEGPKGSQLDLISSIFTFLTFTTHTTKPSFIIYKPGYCPWPKGFGIDACKRNISPEGRDAIIAGETAKLAVLTEREDRRKARPSPAGYNKRLYAKQPLLINAVRAEYEYLYSKDAGDLYQYEED
jgi:hypothetical protein